MGLKQFLAKRVSVPFLIKEVLSTSQYFLEFQVIFYF